MPLYEYQCEACGEFEAWRTIAQVNTPMFCLNCEKPAKRLFSPPNINLNSGSFPLANPREPRLVKQEREPDKPRYQTTTSGRPWMVNHAPPRY